MESVKHAVRQYSGKGGAKIDASNKPTEMPRKTAMPSMKSEASTGLTPQMAGNASIEGGNARMRRRQGMS